jgi:hypothetical protein
MGATQDIETADTTEIVNRFELRRIANPHPDIELGVARASLEYLVCTPDRGINTDTGLVLFFVGYGMEPCGRYVRSLLSYLANKHNCIAASVDYFGADIWNLRKCRWIPHPDFFTNLKKHHGIEVNAPKGFDTLEMINKLVVALHQRGVKSLAGGCGLLGISPEYNSMGVLPALDGLQVTHCLVEQFALNKRRLFLLGTSYGGYIANLMVKFAPKTFRMVIDNSGFSSAEDDIWSVYGKAKMHYPDGFAVNTMMIAAFSEDAAAINFFSPARREIRNLLNRAHCHESTARLYAYHSIEDAVAPAAKKLALREIYSNYVFYELEIIDHSTLDGRIFKDLSHGMHASLRGVFDCSYDKFLRDGGPLAENTDYDTDSCYVFPCVEEDYVIRFSGMTGVTAELRKAKPQAGSESLL